MPRSLPEVELNEVGEGTVERIKGPFEANEGEAEVLAAGPSGVAMTADMFRAFVTDAVWMGHSGDELENWPAAQSIEANATILVPQPSQSLPRIPEELTDIPVLNLEEQALKDNGYNPVLP